MTAGAPLYSIASDSQARAESAAWSQFSAAQDEAAFCGAWLAILCAQIQRVQGALLVLARDAQGGYGAAAVWPDAQRDMQYLAPMAERSLKERRGLLAGLDGAMPPARDQHACVGYPIEVNGVLHGAVVLDLPPSALPELQRALRLLHWASAWLVDRFRQQTLHDQGQRLARIATANDLLATCLQARQFGPSALALANALTAKLRCERASVGFERQGAIEVQALSHTATFDRRSETVRQIAEAMEEALDLGVAVVHPPPPAHEAGADAAGGAGALHGVAQSQLATAARRGAVCSVPLVDEGRTFGVLTLERDGAEPFDDEDQMLLAAVGALAGPVFALQRDQARGIGRRLLDSLGHGRRMLVGPGHPGVKLIAGTATLAVLALLVVALPYRVGARTVIEGEVQRAAVAPFQGYLAEALVRAGETVRAGQPMARLLDRELKLEQARWSAEREVAERRWRQMAAAGDRAAMAMALAQVAQAQAQLSLVDEKLARATVTAPFDGVVVQGDLTQLLGSPLEQGKVLFEVAPLDRYRVILEVDERDVGQVRAGQRGELVVSGIPGEAMPFQVTQVTPISTSKDGRNHFRVEARVDGPSPRLRPGMEGVGKVEVGERRLFWIWTHGFTDWLRLAWWRWAP